MKLIKFATMAAAATVGLIGLNTKAAVPSGYEPVNVKATLLAQDGDKVQKLKITTDDVLALIDSEYDTAYANQDGGSGFKLVTFGVDEEPLAVSDKDGNVVLSNASSDADNYFLTLNPFYDDEWVNTISGSDSEKYNFTIAGVELTYRSNSEADSFFFEGLATDKVNYDTDSENFHLKNGEGYFDFGSQEISGVISGASVSASGKDIDDPFDD